MLDPAKESASSLSDRIRKTLMQGFKMCRKGEEIVGRTSRMPLFPPVPHDVEAIEADVEQLLE